MFSSRELKFLIVGYDSFSKKPVQWVTDFKIKIVNVSLYKANDQGEGFFIQYYHEELFRINIVINASDLYKKYNLTRIKSISICTQLHSLWRKVTVENKHYVLLTKKVST